MNLTFTLANTDFKLTYFGSALGYLWSLMRPLLFFGVLDVVFTQDLPRRHAHPALRGDAARRDHLLDVLPAGRPATACSACSAREGLLRKMRFPRLVIPLAVALTALFHSC